MIKKWGGGIRILKKRFPDQGMKRTQGIKKTSKIEKCFRKELPDVNTRKKVQQENNMGEKTKNRSRSRKQQKNNTRNN